MPTTRTAAVLDDADSRPGSATSLLRTIIGCYLRRLGGWIAAPALMELMTTGKFRHLPVIEDEKVIGVVSIGDVVKHRLQEIEQESAALRDYIQTA